MSQSAPENEPQIERPEGVTEDEWNALNDPGKAAIVRERAARAEAERALAAAKARPAPPKAPQQPAAPASQPTQQQSTTPEGAPDIAKVVQEAVAAAIKPFEERENKRTAEAAAGKVIEAVEKAAADRFHSTADAVANVDLTTLTDDQGRPDATKISAALDQVLKESPHYARPVDDRRFAPPGAGAGGSAVPTKEQVDKILAEMQNHTGIKPTAKS